MKKQDRSILIKNIDYLVTMNKRKEILKNISIFIKDNKIKEVKTKKTTAEVVIDARGMIAIPGLINCHHHMFQCGLRGLPELQNRKIDKWIQIVCKYARKMDEETIYYSALGNIAELLLYGCTTTADMLYIFPKGKKGFFESLIKAAHDIGIRFHPYRGSMSLSRKNGQLFPDDVVEDSDKIANDSEEMIRKHHISSPFSMMKIGCAPCTIFTSAREDFENALLLSKKYEINLQTHLSETEFENHYAVQEFKQRPLQYLQQLGWEGEKVSFTHCINLNSREIESLAKTKTQVVHCPISNARSPIDEGGVAPIWEMVKDKVNVGIGVDGSAGNDSSNVLEELRWARTLQGSRKQSTYLKPMETLEIGTINGARVLNWEKEIGSIEVGKAADIALFNLQDNIEFAGYNNPLLALLGCQARRANTVLVDGKVVVRGGNLITFDEEKITRKINNISN